MCTNLKDLRSGGEGRFEGCVSENGFLQLSAVFEHEDVFSKMAARYMLYQSRVGYVVTCMYVWVCCF